MTGSHSGDVVHFPKDEKSSTATSSVFDLTYRNDEKRYLLDHFTIRADDVITEDELVKSAMPELARRQAAFANGTQFNWYGDDPLADRKRLIAQHPAIAVQLGLVQAPATTIALTQPSTVP